MSVCWYITYITYAVCLQLYLIVKQITSNSIQYDIAYSYQDYNNIEVCINVYYAVGVKVNCITWQFRY